MPLIHRARLCTVQDMNFSVLNDPLHAQLIIRTEQYMMFSVLNDPLHASLCSV